MASPGSEFTVINGNSSYAILPLLLTRKIDNSSDDEPNPVKYINVTSLDNSSIKFKVTDTTKYLKAGNYEFNFTTKKLSKK
jgi:hypothetical protein